MFELCVCVCVVRAPTTVLEMSLRRARLSGRSILDMADLPTVFTQNTDIIGRECQWHHRVRNRLSSSPFDAARCRQTHMACTVGGPDRTDWLKEWIGCMTTTTMTTMTEAPGLHGVTYLDLP